jgi:hypothetical protein
MINQNSASAGSIRLHITHVNSENIGSIVRMTSLEPIFRGMHGGFNYICGSCNTILAEDVGKGGIENKIIQCFECLKYNQYP